jgi:hypothetical protein
MAKGPECPVKEVFAGAWLASTPGMKKATHTQMMEIVSIILPSQVGRYRQLHAACGLSSKKTVEPQINVHNAD